MCQGHPNPPPAAGLKRQTGISASVRFSSWCGRTEALVKPLSALSQIIWSARRKPSGPSFASGNRSGLSSGNESGYDFTLILRQHILTEALQAAFAVAVSSPGLTAPPPPRPRQHRFVRGNGLPDQPVQQPAHLGNRQRYQGFIPFLLSPILPPKYSSACRRTTAK